MITKEKKLICIAIILAVLGIVLPESITTISGVQYTLNTTNLAPTFAGIIEGTGERVADNTTYWANNSPIFVSLWIDADTPGQNAELHLYVNGTKYQDTSNRPIGATEESNQSIFHIIPQYANYSVTVANYHHYEWRETKILTGNVSTIITSSGGGSTGGCAGNCSFDVISINGVRKNNTTDYYTDRIYLYSGFINLTSKIYSVFDLSAHGYIESYSNAGHGTMNITPESINLTVSSLLDSSYSNISLVSDRFDINIVKSSSDIKNYSFNSTDADWHGANLTNTQDVTVIGNIYSNNSLLNELYIYSPQGHFFNRYSDTVSRMTFNLNIPFSNTVEDNSSTHEISEDYIEHAVQRVTDGYVNFSSTENTLLPSGGVMFPAWQTMVRTENTSGIHSNSLSIDSANTKITISNGTTTTYKLNESGFDLGERNISNVRNITSNYPDSNLSTGMFYRTGLYLGDGTANKPIYHGLGRIPVFITISRKSDGGYGQIQMGMDGLMQNPFGIAVYRVTEPDETYFYVGNSTSYINSMNPSGYNMVWVAWG